MVIISMQFIGWECYYCDLVESTHRTAHAIPLWFEMGEVDVRSSRMYTKFDFCEEKKCVYAPIEMKREVAEDEVWRKRLPRVILSVIANFLNQAQELGTPLRRQFGSSLKCH